MKKVKNMICTVLLTSILLSCIGSFAACNSTDGKVFTPLNSPQQFASAESLHDALEEYAAKEPPYYRRFFNSAKGGEIVSEVMPETAAPSVDAANDYSDTNIQTEGVDEGDIVKVDGSYIYRISTNGCTILRAEGGELELASTIAVKNYVPKELYLNDDTLIMIGGLQDEDSFGNFNSGICYFDYYRYLRYQKTDVRVYDVSNRTAPVLQRQITLDGVYNTSRLTDGRLIYTLSYSFSYGNKDDYIPKLYDSALGAESKAMDVADIFYYDLTDYYYTIVGDIDLSSPLSGKHFAYLGLNGETYVSADNIFMAQYRHRNDLPPQNDEVAGYTYSSQYTAITKLSLKTLRHLARGEVEGNIIDRYSLDEYEGYLRIATNVSRWGQWADEENDAPVSTGNFSSSQYSIVYVLDEHLSVVAKTPRIAEGESLYSVRFNKETASLVTFKNMDPLFKVDLSNPLAPTVSAGLKEDGVSYYLHYLGDTAYTIGVGKDTEAVSETSARSKGIKISLYDNSGADAVNLKTYVLGDSGNTELLYNPKALLYDYDRKLFAFPVEYYDQDDEYQDYYSQKVTQGLAVFSFDTENGKLYYRGILGDYKGANMNDIYGDYSGSYYSSVITRGVRIGDYIYTIADEKITAYDLETLTETDSIKTTVS